MNFNNDSDSEDTYNIFNKKIDLKKNEQETIKIDITSKNSTTNDKLLNAQKLLDNQKDKLTSNTNNFGANSNIGFLNSNFSLGKSSLLNSLSLNKETEQIPLNKVDNEEFSMKKGNMKNNIGCRKMKDLSFFSLEVAFALLHWSHLFHYSFSFFFFIIIFRHHVQASLCVAHHAARRG